MDAQPQSIPATGQSIVGRLPAAPSESSIALSALSSLKSERLDYTDNRNGVAAHPAIKFSMNFNKEAIATDLIKEFVGEAWGILVSGWGDISKCNIAVTGEISVVLFLDSDLKSRSDLRAEFAASGLEYADDIQATIVCAAVVKKAKDLGLDISKEAKTWGSEQADVIQKLDPNELEFLTKLRSGAFRTKSGMLHIILGYNNLHARLANDDYILPGSMSLGMALK